VDNKMQADFQLLALEAHLKPIWHTMLLEGQAVTHSHVNGF